MTKRVAVLLMLLSATAHAGGLFLPVRTVRATGRGGTFVAGADDPSALWFNPAGLAHILDGGRAEGIFDLAYVGHDVSYARIDSGGQPEPIVGNDQQVLPIPQIAVGIPIGKKSVVGFGLAAPYAAIDGYPEDGPQRYQLVTLHGSAFAILSAGLAVKVKPWLTVGGTVQNLFFGFRSRLVFSACPREIVCAPEDPEFDSLGEIEGADWVSPSASVGAQAALGSQLRFGASLQAPFFVAAGGKFRTRLPSSGFYEGARVVGDSGEVRMTLPAILRVAAEARPLPNVRVEAGVDWEMWSMHKRIVIQPLDVRVEDIPGVGIYELGEVEIPRRLRDTIAFRVGAEAQPLEKLPLVVRAGYVFETGSARNEYISVFSPDTQKHVLTLGLGWQAKRFRIDASFAKVFQADAVVAPGKSCLPQVNPIRTGMAPADPPDGELCIHDDDPAHLYIGDGTYASGWTVFGIGLSLKL
jgi:long-chain fatty acid transport protein